MVKKDEKDLSQYQREKSKKIQKTLEVAEESAHGAHLAYHMLEKVAHSMVGGVEFVGKVIPPLRVLLLSLAGVWDVFHAVFISKSSRLARASRSGIAIAAIAIGMIAFAVPTLAISMLIASAGIGFFKQVGLMYGEYKKYRHNKKLLIEIEHDIHLAHSRHDYKKVQYLLEQREHVFVEMHKAREHAVKKALDSVYTAVTVVGAIFLATPLAPIGAIMLLATAAVAVTHRVGRWFKRLFSRKGKVKPKPMVLKTAKKDKPAEQDQDELLDQNQHEKKYADTEEIFAELTTGDEASQIEQSIQELEEESIEENQAQSALQIEETAAPIVEEKADEEEDADGEGGHEQDPPPSLHL